MEEKILKSYEEWLEKAVSYADIREELDEIRGDEEKITDAFYRDLEFGTGGLRGVLGAGTNRMNEYTVGKASQGLANYVLKHFPEGERRIAVSYDSRIKSDVFSKTASALFAANGIKVYLYPELMPTPCLSYAVRALRCSAGIMVTASHNPSKYNGYKVYGPDGCQCTTEAADAILSEINGLDIFRDVKFGDFDALLEEGMISWIDEQVYTDFIAEVTAQSVLPDPAAIDKNVAIVYTPLNGTGLKPVTRALRENGYGNITVVKEQEMPDGHFPTCPYPNPEIREAMALGMEYAKKLNAELLIATDPDCDRVGIAAADKNGEYVLVSGNEVGCLLLDYIINMRKKGGRMPGAPMIVKTIVSTDMADRIAEANGVRVVNVLTGFKFIGEQIGLLEAEGHEDYYIFGFEESYGYLTGTYVRDKDAVDAAFMIVEMFAYYKSIGVSILDKLQELYETYGYYLNRTYSFEFEGIQGVQKMKDLMEKFRGSSTELAGRKVLRFLDYSQGIDGLPKSDVLKYYLEGDASVVVRPSGTEPKLKIYVSVRGRTKAEAEAEEQQLSELLKEETK